jgi:hypothetical protein
MRRVRVINGKPAPMDKIGLAGHLEAFVNRLPDGDWALDCYTLTELERKLYERGKWRWLDMYLYSGPSASVIWWIAMPNTSWNAWTL